MQAWPKHSVALHTWIAALLAGVGAAVALVSGAALWVIMIGPVIGLGWRRAALTPYRRRQALVAAPFPEKWRAQLEDRVAFYRRLAPAGRARFEADVAIFLAEQRIMGPQQSPVPEDICLLIAAAAAMLGHGRPEFEWPTTRDIIVHLTNFNEHHEPGDHHEIAGVVHHHGPMVLSRKQVRFGFRKSDGTNVAVHELAHVLDLADGSADGSASIWHALPGWDALVRSRLKQVRRGGRGAPLRAYAGTNEAELFAVAVEAFFETPDKLRARDPELFAALTAVFNLDPATGALHEPRAGV
jgi:Mlc titration factor MtfA (ptsG expression regulator)